VFILSLHCGAGDPVPDHNTAPPYVDFFFPPHTHVRGHTFRLWFVRTAFSYQELILTDSNSLSQNFTRFPPLPLPAIVGTSILVQLEAFLTSGLRHLLKRGEQWTTEAFLFSPIHPSVFVLLYTSSRKFLRPLFGFYKLSHPYTAIGKNFVHPRSFILPFP